MIRKLEYEEIARTDPLYAMRYLQTKLSDVIDHNDEEQLKEFHKLTALLFRNESQCTSSLSSTPTCSSPDLESKNISDQLEIKFTIFHYFF